MKFVLLFGSTGMLGRYVLTYLSTDTTLCVVPIKRENYDASIDDYKKLEYLLKPYDGIDAVCINCIGIIPQKESNNQSKLYMKVNALFPQVLSQLCDKMNIRLIHITTDCVFNGNTTTSYSEDSIHTETNIYGISKSLGEPTNACVIRTSIIGEELIGKKSLLEWIKSNKNGTINGFVNHMWNGVTCLELAKIIHQIIKQNNYWSGVRHIFSPNIVSKYELANMINEIWDLNISINKFETDIVNKTLTTKYKTNNAFEIKNLYEQLEELKKWSLDYREDIEHHLYWNI